jgi:16S rRNA G966 N2-methylase RsmD
MSRTWYWTHNSIQEFSTPLHEKLFVIDSNLNRRQLSTFARVELALSKKPILQQFARNNMVLGGKGDRNLTPLGRVDDTIAVAVTTSRDTVRKVEFLLKNAPAEKLDRLRQGKTKISKEYQRVQKAIAIQELGNKLNVTISCSNNSFTNLMLGDMWELGKNVPDESVDLIFTDPPYAEKYLYLYEELLRQSERVLKQGGSLVIVAPNQLDKIFAMLSDVKLNYAEIIAVHQNGSTPKMWKNGIWADCKFLVWCFKGDKPTKFHDLSNFVESEPVSKHNHDWEQSTVEAMHMIKPLTLEGMTVLDPFMGSGTTGLAALKLTRKFIGIEISPLHYSIAQTRLSAVTAAKVIGTKLNK